jgi:imidazolonepropionase
MTTLIINIKELLKFKSVAKVSGAAMAILPTIKNAYLLIEDNLIADFGSMDNLPKTKQIKLLMPQENDIVSGATVIPTLFTQAIEQEFVDRINGLSYEEIANRGGGILNSAKSSTATEEDIYINPKSVWKK